MTATTASPAEEWVEIYNPCASAVDVTGWTLVYRGANVTGATDSTLLTSLTGLMAPGEFRLYAGIDYLGTNDGKWMETVPNANGLIGKTAGAVGLRAGAKDTGDLQDSIAYGTATPGHPFIEKQPTPAMDSDKSASRLPLDGNDRNDNSVDFQIIAVGTPRASNGL